MIALCIILGIILLFVLVLSIRAHVHIQYEDVVTAYLKWAFLKIDLLPLVEKEPKPKKEKPKKEAPPKEEAPPAEPKPKGPNPFMTFYENEKLQGVIDLLKRLLAVVDKFGRRLVKAFVIDEMFLDITVAKGDAAETAEEYGKMYRRVFPVAGAVCANCNVKQYSINIDPDYLAKRGNEFAFSLEISLIPRRLINAVLLFALGAVFKVGIKFLKGIKPKNNPAAQPPQQENPDGEPMAEDLLPIKETVYGSYEEGSVSEPEIYIDDSAKNSLNNTESGG